LQKKGWYKTSCTEPVRKEAFMPRVGKISKAPEGFYTASEAIKKLNMPRTTFHHYVKIGKIKKKVPRGRKEGYYEKAYIDRMAEASELYAIQYAEEPIVFSVATDDDLPGIYDVLVSLWGTLNATTTETRLSWHKVNPEIDYVVKQEGIVVGFVNLKPLRHETIEQYIKEEIQVKDIKARDILSFTPGVPLECEAGIAVRAGVQNPKKYGMRLLGGIIDKMVEFARKGIIIDKIYTRSSTPDGIRIARGLGFEDISPTPHQNARLFLLDFNTSDSPFVKRYQDILKQSSDILPLEKNHKQGDAHI